MVDIRNKTFVLEARGFERTFGIFLGWFLAAGFGCTAQTPEESAPSGTKQSSDSVRFERYAADLQFVAEPRPPGSAHWKRVQDKCAAVFEDSGFAVERQGYGTGVNVIGTKMGTVRPDESVIISAHYDSVENCPGADDNASGVAGVLEAARALSSQNHQRTLKVACWDEEEFLRHRPLIGSWEYAERAHKRGEEIAAVYVLEMIGFMSEEVGSQEIPPGLDILFPEQAKQVVDNQNRADFISILGNTPTKDTLDAFSRAANELSLRSVSLYLTLQPVFFIDLIRSDHASFWLHNYPAVVISDSANFRNPNYHCVDGRVDDVASLNLPFAVRVVRATVATATASLNPS